MKATNEHDRDEGPRPSFWTAHQESAWDRVREALRRDWLQTEADLGLPGSASLGHTLGDTVRQAIGPPSGARKAPDWEVARHAVRLGHGAANHWDDVDEWNDDLEAKNRAEWEGMSAAPWEEAQPLVRFGWMAGRKERGVLRT